MTTISRVQLAALAAALAAQAQGGYAQGLQAPQGGEPAPIACDFSVTGQNDSAVDILALSNAVNAGGLSGDVTVCLSGTFDFGDGPPPAGQLLIAPAPAVTSLRIVGLTDARGRRATIRNGVLPLALRGAAPVPKLGIASLRFENPRGAAIHIERVDESLIIKGVQIAGARNQFFPALNLSTRIGINITSFGAAIHGDLVIADNVIDGGAFTASDGSPFSAGIVLAGGVVAGGVPFQPFDAHVRVTNNRIANWSSGGIVAATVGDVTISRNKIDPGSYASNGGPCANAAAALSGILLTAVTDSVVRDNEINVSPAFGSSGIPAPCTAGIVVRGSLDGPADGNIVYGNVIRGTGAYALVVGAPTGSVETDNFFALNPVWGFAAQKATLLLGPGATGNALIGVFPSIEGNTAGNSIIRP
jgi:hypothetical protein